jgi:hypothetical protein
MSSLESFAFATTSKTELPQQDMQPGFFGGILRTIRSNDENLSKASPIKSVTNVINPYLNTRSARPGIPSYDYSPAYTNRLWLSWCYWYEDEVTILSDVFQKMRDEVFRYGFSIKPAFAKKCNTCGQEYDEDVEECEVCKSRNIREPDKAEKRAIRVDQFNTIIDKANLNGQSLREVLKTVLFHMLVTDNGYLLAHKEYHWDATGSLRAFPKEYFALDPRDVIKLFDFQTGYPGRGRVCLDHRSSLCGENDMNCPTCGKPTFRAFYQVFTATKTSTYYIDDEIMHLMYYYPSIIYGYPKCLKIKDELIAYHMIEKRVRNYYEFCKVPGILFIPTDDPEALQEMWQKVRDGTKDDPFTPAVLGVSEMAPTNANFIRLMQDPNAELIAIKDELRMRIASVFGITIAFINDTSNTGGQKNDKNMISQGDRTIRSLQEIIDEKLLRWIFISMGITDWKLKCEPNITDNKLEAEEVRAAQINNMERYSAMGLKVTYKGEDYTVGKGPVMSPEMMMMGMGPPGAGGAPAMGPPLPMAGAPMGPPSAGIPMMPTELGGMTSAPPLPGAPPMGGPGMQGLDMMAAGQVQPGAMPGTEPEPQFSDTMRAMKQALGVSKDKRPKKTVSTKLSRIVDRMFMTDDERNEKLKAKEEEASQAGAMPGMPPAMPGLGGAPMGMDSGAGMPPAPPVPPTNTPPNE